MATCPQPLCPQSGGKGNSSPHPRNRSPCCDDCRLNHPRREKAPLRCGEDPSLLTSGRPQKSLPVRAGREPGSGETEARPPSVQWQLPELTWGRLTPAHQGPDIKAGVTGAEKGCSRRGLCRAPGAGCHPPGPGEEPHCTQPPRSQGIYAPQGTARCAFPAAGRLGSREEAGGSSPDSAHPDP